MKIKKVLNVNQKLRNVNITKAQKSSLKVIEKVGLIHKIHDSSVDTGKNNVNLEFRPNLVNKISILFVKEVARSRDDIKNLNLYSNFINSTSVKSKGPMIKIGGTKDKPINVTFIFTTEKGMRSQVDCIKNGIGGKLFSYVVTK